MKKNDILMLLKNFDTLVVNGVYRNRAGQIVVIETYNPNNTHCPFECSLDEYYPDGRYMETPTNYDLIEYLGTLRM